MNQIINLYLSYVNDFNTVERFANLYRLDIDDANLIIEMGRKYNERNANVKKEITNYTNKYYRWK
jgi:hypothetical protein